jgi:HD-GYP domain-containing protein (c-di-GMP phosphodiesterase class II)
MPDETPTLDVNDVGGNNSASYRAVPVELLRPEEIADFDIYLQSGPGRPYVLYRKKHLPFTAEEKERLEEHRVTRVHIHTDQEADFQRYVERNLGTIMDDSAVAPEEKAEVLYGSLVGVVEDVLSDPRAGDMVPRSKQIVANACKFLYGQGNSLEHMMRVCSFDYYTYTHSVNVFVFTMTLGQKLFDKDFLVNEVGLGALLHDVGKSRIDPAIINCKGKLTAEQFETIKLHPVYSDEILREKGGVPAVSLDMARHHHERIKGGGYPDNLEGNAISKEVRVVTLADIFDALTTRRSYKEPIDSFPALKLMREEMTEHLDMELFGVFVQMMGKL